MKYRSKGVIVIRKFIKLSDISSTASDNFYILYIYSSKSNLNDEMNDIFSSYSLENLVVLLIPYKH